MDTKACSHDTLYWRGIDCATQSTVCSGRIAVFVPATLIALLATVRSRGTSRSMLIVIATLILASTVQANDRYHFPPEQAAEFTVVALFHHSLQLAS